MQVRHWSEAEILPVVNNWIRKSSYERDPDQVRLVVSVAWNMSDLFEPNMLTVWLTGRIGCQVHQIDIGYAKILFQNTIGYD